MQLSLKTNGSDKTRWNKPSGLSVYKSQGQVWVINMVKDLLIVWVILILVFVTIVLVGNCTSTGCTSG